MNYFYRNMKYLRLQKGMSMEAFGNLLGVNASTIMRWEKNNNGAKLDNVIFICNKLNIPINVLVGVDISSPEYKDFTNNKIDKLSENQKKIINNMIEEMLK